MDTCVFISLYYNHVHMHHVRLYTIRRWMPLLSLLQSWSCVHLSHRESCSTIHWVREKTVFWSSTLTRSRKRHHWILMVVILYTLQPAPLTTYTTVCLSVDCLGSQCLFSDGECIGQIKVKKEVCTIPITLVLRNFSCLCVREGVCWESLRRSRLRCLWWRRRLSSSPRRQYWWWGRPSMTHRSPYTLSVRHIHM